MQPVGALFLVEVDQGFGVAVGAKAMAFADQIVA